MVIVAAIFWWFYVLVCPLFTIVGALAAMQPNHAGQVSLYRAAGVTCVLVLLFAPAATEVGPMSWWFARMVADAKSGSIYVWQYAVACVVLQLLIAAVRALKRDHGRGRRSDL